jgi:hypothetical protein
MGDLFSLQAITAKALVMYVKALPGFCSVLSQSSERCMALAANIDTLPLPRREHDRHPELPIVGEGSAPQHE